MMSSKDYIKKSTMTELEKFINSDEYKIHLECERKRLGLIMDDYCRAEDMKELGITVGFISIFMALYIFYLDVVLGVF